MNKTINILLSLVIMATPAFVFATDAAPVVITGSQPSRDPAAVGSALDNSVTTETSSEKPQKYSKPFHTSAAAPVSMVSATEDASEAATPITDADYAIRPGDVLQVTVWKEDNLDREVLVLPDGTIDFPLIGSFTAAGMTPGQLQNTIKSKLHALIPGASVAVLVKATLGHSVSVIGQVNKPGEIIMSHSLTGMQALSQAGGLTPYASEGRIKVLRVVGGKEVSIDFPYDDIASGNHLDKDIMLRPGDVMVVPTASLIPSIF